MKINNTKTKITMVNRNASCASNIVTDFSVYKTMQTT
jgi:hypothetical protein